MLHQVLEVIRSYDRFLIVTHMRPDGDAVGSQLALGTVLKSLGKKVTMLNSDLVPHNMNWLPGSQTIKRFKGWGSQILAVANAEVILVVDTNALHRLGPAMQKQVQNSQALKVLIDHHTEPEDWFDVQYVREDAVATAEIIYEIIVELDERLLTADVATALYTAIMTDSGSFRFPTVSADSHRVTADLIERGSMDPAEVYEYVYQSRSRTWPRLVSRVLESFTLLHDGQLAYLQLTNRMFKETQTHYDDAEGLIEWAMAVEGVRVVLMMTETRRGVKVSFRSKGDIKVDEWAREVGGGGHPNASGAYFRTDLAHATKRVLEVAARHMAPENEAEEYEMSREDEQYLAALTSLQS